MKKSYEIMKSNNELPMKIFIDSINNLKMHWHRELEILLVLEGSINVQIKHKEYFLEENDLILVNANTVHNLSKTNEENIILKIQIDSDYFTKYYPELNKIIFDCKSFNYGEKDQEKFDFIRTTLAKIVWQLNENKNELCLIIGSELHLLLDHLVENFNTGLIKKGKRDKNMERIQNILNYIDENIENKVSLQDVADRENLNFYYLSHFIKKMLGISFQEYINIQRIDKAVVLLMTTNKTIKDIASQSGFPSTKSLNRLFKREYDCTPTEYRKKHKEDKKKINIEKNIALEKLYRYL